MVLLEIDASTRRSNTGTMSSQAVPRGEYGPKSVRGRMGRRSHAQNYGNAFPGKGCSRGGKRLAKGGAKSRLGIDVTQGGLPWGETCAERGREDGFLAAIGPQLGGDLRLAAILGSSDAAATLDIRYWGPLAYSSGFESNACWKRLDRPGMSGTRSCFAISVGISRYHPTCWELMATLGPNALAFKGRGRRPPIARPDGHMLGIVW